MKQGGVHKVIESVNPLTEAIQSCVKTVSTMRIILRPRGLKLSVAAMNYNYQLGSSEAMYLKGKDFLSDLYKHTNVHKYKLRKNTVQDS